MKLHYKMTCPRCQAALTEVDGDAFEFARRRYSVDGCDNVATHRLGKTCD